MLQLFKLYQSIERIEGRTLQAGDTLQAKAKRERRKLIRKAKIKGFTNIRSQIGSVFNNGITVLVEAVETPA